MLLEIRTAPVLAQDTRANAIAMSFVVLVLLGDMLTSIEGLLIVGSVVAVHELGHYVAMRCFGYRDPNVLFVPLPVRLTSEQGSASGWQHVTVLLLGPMPGLLGAALLALAHPGAEHLSRDSIAWQVLVASAWINGLNLLPLIPFDGGSVARILFFAERPAAQVRVGWILASLVGLLAVSAHRWDLVVAAVVAVLFGLASAGASRVGAQLRSRRLAELAAAPRLAKNAPETLLRDLFEDYTSHDRARSLRSRSPSDVAQFLSLAYSAAVTPPLSVHQRVALAVVYLGVSVPLAFVLLDLFVGTAFR